MTSSISDDDIVFTGNDGGSTITALRLDMSDAGSAIFNADVNVDRYLKLRTTDDHANSWLLYTHTDDTLRINYNGAGDDEVVIDTSGNVGFTSTPTAWGSGYKSLQIGDRGYVAAHTGSDLYVGQNAYHNSGWKYESTAAASLTQHSGGQITHFVAASGSADSAITWTRALHIKSNGHVGLNSDNPYTRFEVVGTSTAAYSATSFNAGSQIGIKQPDNNGGYTGIRFTNVGGNYEGFIGFTQTTASPNTKADFVVQGYNRDTTTYQEKFRITDGGEVSTPQNIPMTNR